MKKAEIISHRYQDRDYLFHTEFEWRGSKYAYIDITSRLTGKVINSNKNWKLKILDHNYFLDTDLLVRGDVWYGVWWRIVRVEYFIENQLYREFKYRVLKFLMFKPLHIGYIEEGKEILWRDLFRRKPK
jgi:hypothetical protein